MAGADRCVGCGGILPEGYGWSHDICPVETENDVRKDIQADIPEESQNQQRRTVRGAICGCDESFPRVGKTTRNKAD